MLVIKKDAIENKFTDDVCVGVYYYWWNEYFYNGAIYLVTVLSIILLLFTPIKFGIMICLAAMAILLLAYLIRIDCKSAVASTWCLAAVLLPIGLFIYFKSNLGKNIK